MLWNMSCTFNKNQVKNIVVFVFCDAVSCDVDDLLLRGFCFFEFDVSFAGLRCVCSYAAFISMLISVCVGFCFSLLPRFVLVVCLFALFCFLRRGVAFFRFRLPFLVCVRHERSCKAYNTKV